MEYQNNLAAAVAQARRAKGEFVDPPQPEPSPEPVTREFAFDVRLFSTLRVKAASEAEARALLREHVDCADANFGAWPSGDPILGEASLDDGEPDLIEIDGEAV